MKQRQSLYVFLVIVIALFLEGGVAAQTPCDQANALLNATLYDQAQANYTTLLNQTPTLQCARDGILAVQRMEAIKFYELGRAYENASQVKDAQDAYVAALKIYPNYSDAQAALARMNGGILTLAYTLYMRLLPGLEYIAVGAIVLLIIYVLIYQIRLWIKGFIIPRLDIQEFDKGATGLESGKGLKAMVGASYKQLVSEGRNRGLNLVDGPTEKISIPADEKVAPYFKFVSDLIDWLFPPYVINLSGSMQKPGSRGAGITVTLVVNRSKEILGSSTIWEKDIDLETLPRTAEEKIDLTSYYNLVEPAAIWVLFQLGKLSKKKEFTMMGTNDWKSYAYFKAGVRWQLQGRPDKAQQLYVVSLGSTMKNWGALLNLGRMEMEAGQYQHAFERLKLAKEATNSDGADKFEKSKGFPRNRIWYLVERLTSFFRYSFLRVRWQTDTLVEFRKLFIKQSTSDLQSGSHLQLPKRPVQEQPNQSKERDCHIDKNDKSVDEIQ